MDHLVATDAIGMGLNLDIDHVVFTGLDEVRRRRARARSRRPRSARSRAAPAATCATATSRPTAELGPLDRRLVEAVEAHRFAPLATLYWRTDELDFFSPLALLGSLERQPPHPFLVRMRHAEDQRALAALVARRRGDGARPRAPSGAPALGGVPGAGLPGRR